MKTCPLLKAACWEALLEARYPPWYKPVPLRTPFTARFPNGPLSKVAGGRSCNGPTKVGVGRAVGGGAAGVAARGCSPGTGACGSAGFEVGASWALQTEANPKQRTIAATISR